MKLSLKGQYGVRAAFALALHSGADPLPLKLIAEDQAIPAAFLEQILQSLKRAGFVSAVRGARGGYLLACAPDAISVGDVLAALDINLSLVDCLEEDAPCLRMAGCAMRLVYERLNMSMMRILGETTLRDMVDDHHRLETTQEERL